MTEGCNSYEYELSDLMNMSTIQCTSRSTFEADAGTADERELMGAVPGLEP